MLQLRTLSMAVMLFVTCAAGLPAADISGTWKASFDTQVGQQNYTYTFVVKEGALTGKIQSEMGGTPSSGRHSPPAS
jgi:hypothetical protein